MILFYPTPAQDVQEEALRGGPLRQAPALKLPPTLPCLLQQLPVSLAEAGGSSEAAAVGPRAGEGPGGIPGRR